MNRFREVKVWGVVAVLSLVGAMTLGGCASLKKRMGAKEEVPAVPMALVSLQGPQATAIASLISREQWDRDEAGKKAPLARTPRLRRMGLRCRGRDLFVLPMQEVVRKLPKGGTDDQLLAYSGSGGILMPIVAWDEKNRSFKKVFADTILGFEKPKDGWGSDDCPDIVVLVHASFYGREGAEPAFAFLRFSGKHDQYFLTKP
jgi:hypothetical protein